MTYWLGVDIGTTFTAAAVYRSGRADVVQLGNRHDEIPSIVLVEADGQILVGEAAARRALLEPGRVAREFKRRMGDPVPILVGGAPFSAHSLMARVLEHVLQTVVGQQEGEAPAGITMTCPANWGPYKRDLLAQAARMAGVGDVELRSEPESAAVMYATGEQVRPGEIIAVYDLGGGTFDAAVLRKTIDGFELLGAPEGIEQLGGIDFDDAVFHHVVDALGAAVEGLDSTDPAVTAALTRLRRDCVDAKEFLSYDTMAAIPVALPDLHTSVRISQSELEGMVRPALLETVAALHRALRSAAVAPDQLRSVLLAGGSSRIPLVKGLLAAELGCPIVLDARPEQGVALGAALIAGAPEAAAARQALAADQAPPPEQAPEEAQRPAPESRVPNGGSRSQPRGRRNRLLISAAAVAVVGILVVVSMLSGIFRRSPAAIPGTGNVALAAGSSRPTRPAVVPQWKTLAPLPAAVEGAAVAAYDGKVWVAGGISNDASRSKLNKVFVYDPARGSWITGPSLPVPISHAQLVATSWGLYFIGGYVQDGGSKDVLLLNKAGNAWQRQNISLPGTRVGGAAAFDGARIIFAGGTRSDGTAGDEVWSSTGQAWTLVGKLPHGRQLLSAASNGDGTVWIMAGHDQTTGKIYGEVDVVSEGKLNPTAVQPAAVNPPVNGAAAVRVEGSGRCLVGGQTASGYGDWWCDQPGGAAKLPKLVPPRAGLGAAVVGTTVYVVGGSGGGFEGSSLVQSFTPAS